MANLSRQLVSPRSAPLGGTAAGIALFGLMALPASMLALAAIYGLLVAPGQITAGVDWLVLELPTDVALFLTTRLEPSSVASSSSNTLSIAAIGGLLAVLVGAHAGVVVTMQALDRLHHASDPRPFLRRHALAALLTLAGIMLTVGGLAALLVLPQAAAALAWPARAWELLFLLRWPLAFVVVAVYLTALYRMAPGGRLVSLRSAVWGALAGAGLWVVASVALSWWAGGIADYASVYGAVGGTLVAVLWFYLSALAVLLGGIVSAETR
jgi:membrane protein